MVLGPRRTFIFLVISINALLGVGVAVGRTRVGVEVGRGRVDVDVGRRRVGVLVGLVFLNMTSSALTLVSNALTS